MISIVDAALLVHPTVEPSLLVDDLAEELEGEADEVATQIAGFTSIVVTLITRDGMEVSSTKSVISASHPTLAYAVAAKLGNSTLSISQSIKCLGVGLAGGTARTTHPHGQANQNRRSCGLHARMPRVWSLQLDPASAEEGGWDLHGKRECARWPGTGDGDDACGRREKGQGGPGVRSPRRRCAALGNGNLAPVAAHPPVAEQPEPSPFQSGHLPGAMACVYGPAAALVCTLQRPDWSICSATQFTTDEGTNVDLEVDPPIAAARLVGEAVRRWRWNNMAKAPPSLPPEGANFAPIERFLASKSDDAE